MLLGLGSRYWLHCLVCRVRFCVHGVMQVMKIGQMIENEFGGSKDLSGMGGVETGFDAAEFILIGSHTVQVICIVSLHFYCPLLVLSA